MADNIYENEFVNSKENNDKNEEVLQREKEEQANSEPVNYKRVDVEGGIVTDKDEADYYKAIQVNDVIDNCLLGDFDGKGNYVVSPVIVEQLFKMKKVFVSAFDKSVFVESMREFEDYGKINFRLKWTQNSNGQKIVVLELLENINRVNGYFQNTNHVALLGVSINQDTSTEAVYKYFNIVMDKNDDDDDAGAEREDNRDIIDVINRIAYFQIARIGQRKFMAKYYKDAYEKKIALLSKSKHGAYLLEDFNKEYLHCNNRFFKTTDVEYYKYMNQLLDAIIERNEDFIKDDKELWIGLKNLQKQNASAFTSVANAVTKATSENKYMVSEQVSKLGGKSLETEEKSYDLDKTSTSSNKESKNESAPKQENKKAEKKNSSTTVIAKANEEEIYMSSEEGDSLSLNNEGQIENSEKTNILKDKTNKEEQQYMEDVQDELTN